MNLTRIFRLLERHGYEVQGREGARFLLPTVGIDASHSLLALARLTTALGRRKL